MANRTRERPVTGPDAAALLHSLEVHQAELEAQNRELQLINERLRLNNVELAAARDRYRNLYELGPTPYVTVERSGAIVDLNHAAERMVSMTRERMLGGRLELFVTEAGRARYGAFLAELFAAGRARCGDLVVAGADESIDVQIDGVALDPGSEAPARCVLALVDITARRQAEAARRQAQAEVLAIVSHDLRGPLNAIGLACDALSPTLDAEDHQQCISVIQRASLRCERLIKDLLKVAHIESGRLMLELAPLDVGALVRQVCAEHELAVAAAGSTLTVSIDAALAPLVGDRDRLHQVFSNLLGNALVHARGARIEVVVAGRGDGVVISVADDGPGIPAEVLPVVFERYRQGGRQHAGAGLGLAIVKGLVEAHHGAVAVANLERGVRFEVVLPRDPRAAA